MTFNGIPQQTRLPAWAGDVLAIAVVLVTAIVPGPRPPLPHHDASLLLLLFTVSIAVILVPLRRRWPIPTLVLSLALYCSTVLVDSPSTGVGIVAVLAMYAVGSRTTKQTTLLIGSLSTAVVALLSITLSTFGVVDPRVFQIAAAIAVAAALGDSSRSHREYVRVANERAERAEQTREAEAQRRVAEEKLRIAQDLHDTVAHQISVISLNAGVASHALDSDPEKARTALAAIRTASRGVLAEIGTLLRYLRTETGAAVVPPQAGLKDLDELVRRVEEGGMTVDLHTSGDLDRVTGMADAVAYRIVQEGLTNAHKHGAGNAVSVDIAARGEELTISVKNPLAADNDHPDHIQGGLGLVGIRERIASVRGTVDTSTSNGYFVLKATLPLHTQELQ